MKKRPFKKVKSSSSNKNKLVVFGFKDSLVGQVIHMLKEHTNYQVDCLITPYELKPLSQDATHSKTQNKTEFIQNGKIYDRPFFSQKNYMEILKKRKIKKALVLEDNRDLKREIFTTLEKNGVEIIKFIHPTTYLGGHNSMGKGIVIFPQCYIGYKADIGDGTVIQSNCTIEHHSVVGSFVDMNPNVTTGGHVQIGDGVEINISVDIINKISIENGARIGAGSLVLKNCEARTLYYGRPAKKIRHI